MKRQLTFSVKSLSLTISRSKLETVSTMGLAMAGNGVLEKTNNHLVHKRMTSRHTVVTVRYRIVLRELISLVNIMFVYLCCIIIHGPWGNTWSGYSHGSIGQSKCQLYFLFRPQRLGTYFVLTSAVDDRLVACLFCAKIPQFLCRLPISILDQDEIGG